MIDGYKMKMQGKAGEALGISLYSGFVGGLFGLVILVLLTERLSSVALAFTPPSYFALGILGLSVIASLSEESLLKGLMAGVELVNHATATAIGPTHVSVRVGDEMREVPADVTDDAAMVEHLDAPEAPVVVVPGDPSNIKITTPADLAFARALLADREEARHARGHRV